MEKFTTDELRTICWMCQNEAAHIMNVSVNKKIAQGSKAYKRIISISKKAYSELIKRDNNAE